jgi:hypothetical protein
MERLLPAHCGHKKASGNNGCKNAASNNWPAIPAADNHSDGIAFRADPRPLTGQNADSLAAAMASLAAVR